MEPKFILSDVFKAAWKGTRSQLWILAGLLIGYGILFFTLVAFAMPMQSSMAGMIVVNVISGWRGAAILGVRATNEEHPPLFPGERPRGSDRTHRLHALHPAGYLSGLTPSIFLGGDCRGAGGSHRVDTQELGDNERATAESPFARHHPVRYRAVRLHLVRNRPVCRRPVGVHDVWLCFPEIDD